MHNTGVEGTLILNSAQGKYPRGTDAWVRGTVMAIERLACRDSVFVCSSTPLTWDLAVYLAGRTGCPVRLFLAMDAEDPLRTSAVVSGLGLDPAVTDVRSLEATLPVRPKIAWQDRDAAVIHSAATICPVSLNPSGRLAALLASGGYRARVDGSFTVPWDDTGFWRPRHRFGGVVRQFPPGRWLVHWTRASQGPWPDEAPARFFADMLAEPDRYVRSAADTLARILREERIFASSWKCPGNRRAVALSAASAGEAVALMRWRRRYVRYSFEPYGIAIRQEALAGFGAREVTYCAPESAPGADPLFLHAPGEDADWSREREWRIEGDVDFARIAPEDRFAVVPDEAAARTLAERTDAGPHGPHVLFG